MTDEPKCQFINGDLYEWDEEAQGWYSFGSTINHPANAKWKEAWENRKSAPFFHAIADVCARVIKADEKTKKLLDEKAETCANRYFPDGPYRRVRRECERCKGKGHVHDPDIPETYRCPDCNGRGYRYTLERDDETD